MQTIFSSLRLQPIRFLLIGVTVGFITFLALVARVDAVGVAPAILDIKAKPGTVVERTVTVVNTGDTASTFQFHVENFTPSSEPGKPIFDGGRGDDFPEWVSVAPAQVNIAPGQSAPVTVSVVIPADVPPGDYYGVAFVGDSNRVGTSAQAALLMFLTVDGSAHYSIDVVDLSLSDRFTSSLRGELVVKVQNSGNVYIKPFGKVVVNPFIGESLSFEANPAGSRILAGQTREWSFSWGKKMDGSYFSNLSRELTNFALGQVKVTVRLETDEGHDMKEVTYWVFPWRIGVSLLGILFLYCLFRVILRRKAE
ncbi:MAG: hypothetical protein O2877_00260 [bacterium]|nr:hypothetical protein [bacterium]